MANWDSTQSPIGCDVPLHHIRLYSNAFF